MNHYSLKALLLLCFEFQSFSYFELHQNLRCTPNVERVFPFPRPQPKIFLVPLIQNDIPVRVRVAEKALLGMRTLNIAGN